MGELQPQHEPQSPQELNPDPQVIESLRGIISEPLQTVSRKPGSEGEIATVRIVKEGAGILGLEDWKDNKEWSGIFNHVLLSARYTTHFLQQAADRGLPANPQRGLNAMIPSHNGRRQWDEARWYPDVVENAEAKQAISNETLGMQIVEGRIPQDAFDLVVALGHNVEGFSVDPTIYDSLDYKIAIYVDHRTSQKYEPLHERMGEFLLGNFFDKNTVTDEVRQRVYENVKKIIDLQKAYRFGHSDAAKVTVDEADAIAAQIGAHPDSQRLSRRNLMGLILQDADTEAFLIQHGIDVENINDETVPMPRWEDTLRREYVSSALESISGQIYNLHAEQDFLIDPTDVDSLVFERMFPPNTWWGEYAADVYSEWIISNNVTTITPSI